MHVIKGAERRIIGKDATMAVIKMWPKWIVLHKGICDFNWVPDGGWALWFKTLHFMWYLSFKWNKMTFSYVIVSTVYKKACDHVLYYKWAVTPMTWTEKRIYYFDKRQSTIYMTSNGYIFLVKTPPCVENANKLDISQINTLRQGFNSKDHSEWCTNS